MQTTAPRHTPEHPCSYGEGRDLFGNTVEEWPAVSQNPWWHPSDDDRGWDEPLPRQILLAPDYIAELPPWRERFGNIYLAVHQVPAEPLLPACRLAAGVR